MAKMAPSPVMPGGYELFIENLSGELSVVSFTGKEALTKLFSFEVRVTTTLDLLNPTGDAAPQSFLRSRALLKLPVGHTSRFVRGIVASLVPAGLSTPLAGATPAQFWTLRIVPAFWLTKHRVRSRIFQNRSVPEIVAELLGAPEYVQLGLRFASELRRAYPPRAYCTQYQESDYAFIKRILSEEGIFWYFDHGTEEESVDAEGTPRRFLHDERNPADTSQRRRWDHPSYAPLSNAERIVLLDTAEYPPLLLDPDDGDAGPATLSLVSIAAGATPSDALSSFELAHVVKPNAVLLRDYDYERPRLDITASAPSAARPSGELAGDNNALESFTSWVSNSRGAAVEGADAALRASQGRQEWVDTLDGRAATQLQVVEHHSPLGPTRVDDTSAQVRLEQHARHAVRARGTGHCRHMAPGYRFRLRTDVHGVTDLEQDYVVTRVRHVGQEHGSADRVVYRNEFECVPANVAHRPRRKVKKRREMLESATVVGPAGHDVFTDKLGRVKVQFHWDQKGGMNERSSCWVRVLQPWTGTSFGAQFIPRVGTEVMVSFREGDHDRPIVLGGVYNGVQPHPFLPPEGQHKSGFRTRSTPGGGGYSELSFDDTAGHERVVLRAEADLERFVGRDQKTRVVGSDVSQVKGRVTERIGEDVDREVGGNDRLAVEGARRVAVAGKSESRIGEDRVVEVGGAERHRIERTGWLHVGDDLTTETEGNHATVVGRHDAKRSFALHVEGTTQLGSTGITEIVSPKGLRLRCGRSVIELMDDQILVMADKIMLHAPEAQLELNDAGELWCSAEEKVALKAGKVELAGVGAMLSLAEEAELMGQQISLTKPSDVRGLSPEERELTVIELTDEEGLPCPNQRYVLVFEDGSEQSGFLDGEGRAELFLEEGATVRFPGLTDVARGATE